MSRKRASRDPDVWWEDLIADERASRPAGAASAVSAASSAKLPAGPSAVAAGVGDLATKLRRRSLLRFTRRRPAGTVLTQQQVGARRRASILTVIAAVLFVGTACSVGVIMLNNLVIKRSAELGRLESKRRELRTENALMAAEIAKLSAPPRIAKIARKKLNMSQPAEIAKFIYLDESHKPVSAEWQARRAAQLQEQLSSSQASATAALTGGQASDGTVATRGDVAATATPTVAEANR